MSALVTSAHTRPADAVGEREREILALPLVDRGGLHICEAELDYYQLRWSEERHGPLLDVLAELESQGLIESALHFRLTDQGRARLPGDHQPPLRTGTGMRWEVRR
ncbi:MAG: hypothetical protein ABSG43_20765 [Solirubrobacteraceae bacterium]